jgi:SAM-dependent methyltransferase
MSENSQAFFFDSLSWLCAVPECPLYAEPELYDLLFPHARDSASISDEVRRERIVASEQFYLDEAKEAGGRVLELACGSGRLTVPIAQTGVDVVGVDLSDTMLEAARAKASAAGVPVQFVQADMRRFVLPGRFSAIFIAGNSLLHLLTIEDLAQCLLSARHHLAPGRRLIFDISNPDMHLLARDPAQRYPVFHVNDPKRGEVSLEETADYDTATQIRHVRWYFSTPSAPEFRVIDYHLRVIFPQELELLLEAAGLRLERRFGEFQRQPFASSSPRQVCICSVKA